MAMNLRASSTLHGSGQIPAQGVYAKIFFENIQTKRIIIERHDDDCVDISFEGEEKNADSGK